MATRDQVRAAQIYNQVKEVPQGDRKKYGGMAHKLPVLVRSAGLAQALEFVNSRGDNAARKLLGDLAKVVGTQSDTHDVLLGNSRTFELYDYMWLTREVLAALLWYKRFAQSVLGVSAEEGDDREQPTQ